MVNGVIYGLFAFFVIIGFLLGLKRGLWKQVIRIISVVAACFIVVFCAPLLTDSILTADISSAGLEIAGAPVSNLKDALVVALSQVSIVGQLISASPTLESLLNAIPSIIVNLIFFIVAFFVVKGILYFIDIILNKLLIKNDSKDGVNKHRLAGAGIGAVQGIIVFLFVLIPISGTMNMVCKEYHYINENTQIEESLGGNGEGAQTVASAINGYQDNFIIKAFNAVGYKSVTNAVYDKLTIIKIDEQTETTLGAEFETVSKVYVGYDKLKDLKAAEFSTEDEKVAIQLIDDAFESPVIGNVATELVKEAAKTWTSAEPSEFITIAKPEFNSGLMNLFDDLLLYLRADTKADLENDLKVIVTAVRVSADYGVVEQVDGGSADDIVYAVGQEGYIEDLIGTLCEGKVTKSILPSVVHLGIEYAYTALEIEEPVEITKTANEVDWDREKVIQGNLFESISKTYASIHSEGNILDKVDLKNFGVALNCIRDSELLADQGKDITIKLLSSKLLSGVDTTALITSLQNESVYKDTDFDVMFTTLKSSVNIAGDIKDIASGAEDKSLSKEDVGNLIDGLTGQDTTSDLLLDLAKTENLVQSGVDQPTADAVSSIVDAIAGYDTTISGAVQPPKTDAEIEGASTAMEGLLVASKNAKNGDQIFETEQELRNFIDGMLNSPFIYATTINRGVNLGFKQVNGQTNLTSVEEGWLNGILAEYQASGDATVTQCEEIADMFGLEY